MISKKQTSTIIKKILPYLIAFTVSFIAGLVTFHAKKIAPFGDNSILSMDLWGQYFSMYVQKAKADSFSDLLYSWNGAFGYNNWAQSAYYCNSLFLLLMNFIAVKHMVSALNWFCLIKIGLSSVTCLAMLQSKLNKRSPIIVAGAVSYSLCAYMLAFMSQFMWTDSLIYAPLIIMGIDRLIHRKKPLMYALVLGLSIISSFYIGFALCIFSALYFIFSSISELRMGIGGEKRFGIYGWKELGKTVLRFTLFSFLAGGISAAVTLPTWHAIGNTLASEVPPPQKLEWYGNITAILQEMLPERPLSMGYTGVNIFTGILSFLLVPVYFFNKKMRLAERISNALFLAILFISTNCNILDYVWHGFHFPNQLPGRWTFLISLVMVYLGCAGLSRLRGITVPRAIISAVAGFVLVHAVSEGAGEVSRAVIGKNTFTLLAAAALMIIVMAFCELFEKKRTREEPSENKKSAAKKKPVSLKIFGRQYKLYSSQIISICAVTVLAAMQIWSSASNFVNVAKLKTEGLPVSDGVGYAKSVEKMYNLGTQWKNGSTDFYRTEANYGHTFNPSMIGDYHGMGYYSSTMNGKVYQLLRYLGNRVYADKVSSVYNITSPVQNGLFGVKYFLDTAHNLGNLVPDAALIEESEECNIWENPNALPLAYAVSDNALSWEITDEVRAIENQNKMLNAMYGEELNVFERLEPSQFYYKNVTLQENANWNINYFLMNEGQTQAKFNYSLTCSQDGAFYLEHNFRAGKMTITTPDGTRQIEPGLEPFSYLGSFSEGQTLNIEVVIDNISLGCCGLNMYYFNEDKWSQAYERLSEQQLEVSEYKSTEISGKITMQQEGLVFASIPQDGGWTVRCDGKKLETELIGGALIGVKVPKGTHTLEFDYSVPGLGMGLILSIVSLVTALLISFPKLRNKIKKNIKRE